MIFGEVGLNHNGSTIYAKKYIDFHKKLKFDVLTFQIREPQFYERKEKKHLVLPDKFYSAFAKKYSKDPQTYQVGGDLGWINPQTYPIKEINLALPLIKKEECSLPINTSFGFHLLWLEKIKPGGQPSLQGHWPKIESLCLNNKKMVWYEKWIKKQKEKFFIEILN